MRTILALGLMALCNTVVWAQSEIEVPAYNLATNSQWEDLATADFAYQDPFAISLFSAPHGEDSERLWSQTKSVAFYGLGVAGFIALLPEDISNWDTSDDRLISKWWDNVKNGPVWDRDAWYINYIGHPYFGGVYYQVARKSGYRQWDAFMYSFLMSTFYWEYGLEAFAEIPAIQDLMVTPALGWVYGEWAFQKEREIIERGGTVWGSEGWGSTALFFLDPVDAIGRGVNHLFEKEVIKAGTGYLSASERTLPNGETDSQVNLTLRYAVGAGETSPGVKRSRPNSGITRTGDPVDTSRVGITLGGGYTMLDDFWRESDDWVGVVSLGLYFTRQYSLRLSYARGEFEARGDDEELTYENYSLDGQYYFNPDARWRPYLTAGFGEALRDQNRSKKRFLLNGGGGLHYRISAKWAFQFDWRHYYSTRAHSHDDLASGQLVYRFGRGETWL